MAQPSQDEIAWNAKREMAKFDRMPKEVRELATQYDNVDTIFQWWRQGIRGAALIAKVVATDAAYQEQVLREAGIIK